MSIYCVSTAVCLRRVGAGLLPNPFGIVFRAASNELVVVDTVCGVVVLALDGHGGRSVIPDTNNATSVALHRDTLLIALGSRVVALTLQ